MTVSSTTSRADYNGNGVTTAFSVPFYFLEDSHLLVLKTNLTTNVATELTLTTDYTVTGAGNPAGGTVTCAAAPVTGYKVTILRNVPLDQQRDYVENDSFPAESHEEALDKLTMITQQQAEELDRAMLLPPQVSGVSVELPIPEANKLIGWNQGANALQNIDSQTLATIVAFGTANADMFDGDGSTTQFTLSDNPGALNNLDVSIGGVTQTPLLDYTWNGGTTITFTSAPPAGTDNILVRYMQGLPQGQIADGSVAQDSIVDGYMLPVGRGTVHVYPPLTSGGASIIQAPDGSIVSQSGTTTNGLQEAINYCRKYGHNLKVHTLNGAPTEYMFQYMGAWVTTTAYDLQQIVLQGGNYYRCIVAHTAGTFSTDLAANKWVLFDYSATGLGVPTGWPTINGKQVNYRNTFYSISTGLTIGSSQGMEFDFGDAVIAHTAASGDAITLDSAYQSKFKFHHIILSDSNTTGRALKIAPTTNNEYLDGLVYDVTGFFHNRVEAMNLATLSTNTVVGVELDAAGNAITENEFFFNEVEGGLACLRLVQPTGSGAIRGNTFHVNRLYGPNVSGNFALQVGTATSGGSVSDNKFYIGSIMPLHTGAKGIQVYGDGNYIVTSVINDEAGGDVSQGLRLESSASNNVVEMPRCDAVTPVSDASSDTTNAYAYEGRRYAPQIIPLNQWRFFATQSAATTNDKTGDATQYTVICDTEREDAGNVYNNATGVYTAPVSAPHEFAGGVCLQNIAAGHTKVEVLLTTTARTYVVFQGNLANLRDSGNVACLSWSLPHADMASGATAKMEVKVSGSTKTVGVYGQAASAVYTYFSGRVKS